MHKQTLLQPSYYYILRILLAVITGASGTFAFSPYNIWPAAIFSLTGLLSVITNCNYRQSSCFSFFWGIGLFSTGINWIYITINKFGNTSYFINVILIFLFIIYLSFYPIIFSILLVQIWPSTTCARLIFAAPSLWSLTEYLRSYLFGGFPWLQFGYSQINSPLRGLAPIIGVEGITFTLMLISGLLIHISIKKYSILLIMNTTIFFIFLYTLQLIHWYHLVPQKKITITLVQGNIDQKTRWNYNYIQKILNIYLKYSFDKIKKSQIIIWPESAIPDTEITQNNFLTMLDAILKKNDTTIVTGIIDVKQTPQNNQNYRNIIHNSIIVIGENTQPYYYANTNRYIKHHLVPFGEYIPCQKYLKLFFDFPFSYLTPGRYLQSQLIASNIKFTASICYEIIFGNQIRNNFRPDTDCLLTISNNIWFGNSLEPWQHLQIAQMRALELGRPLIHSTNNGITAFIKANGKLQSTLPQFMESELTDEIIPTIGVTPYAKSGKYSLKIICIIFMIIAIKQI